MTKDGVLRAAAFAVIGGSVGWLVGLSVSPVIKDVLTAIVAAVTALVAAAAGITRADGKALVGTVNPVPLAIVLGAMAIVAPLGVRVRESGLLGPTVPAGDSAAKVARTASGLKSIGLYYVPSATACDAARASRGRLAGQGMTKSGDPLMVLIGNAVRDTVVLDSTISLVCPVRR
jgi:hypothetical protein